MDYNSVEEILAAGIENMTALVNNTGYDDNVYTADGADWLTYNNAAVAKVYVSGNTFFGFGANAEHLKVNRQDTKMWYLYREEGTLYNYYHFLKFRWSGYSRYNQTGSSHKMTYDVILWDNGMISLHMVDIPSANYNGTFSLTAAETVTYTAPTADSLDVTFTPTDETHTVYTAENVLADIQLPYDRKYLVRSGSTLYTVTDGYLSALTETTPTAEVFRTHGVDDIPDGSLLVGLSDPEVLYWHDSTDELPKLTMTVTGTPPLPQMFTSEPMDLTHESIAGIDHAEVDAAEDVRFAITFDGGATWKAFDGSAWFEVSETAPGMRPSTMNAITAEQWAEVVVLESYRLRFWIPGITAYVKSVVIHYINP